jgi:glycolate oxidase FAD binding subunit
MLLQPDMRPSFDNDVSRILKEASARGVGVEIVGSGSKRAIGRPTNVSHFLSTSMMKGVTLYEPNEMVMSVRAGTLVSDVMATLAKHGQMLAFEPSEFAGVIGADARAATMGSVFATNASGARRVLAGAARDHLLGVKAISGGGEIFKSGGRVMKNVTGYDVAKLVCGSWGTLAVMSEVTFKVVPVPPSSSTLVLLGLPDEIAVEMLCAAMGTPYEVSGAVHLQVPLAVCLDHSGLRSQGKSITAVRIENMPRSVSYRREKLADILKPYGTIHDLDTDNTQQFWDEIRRLSFFSQTSAQVWRISTAPTNGPKVVAAIARYVECNAFYDWSGGLIWLEVAPSADAAAADIRRVVATHGGHATLMRADPAVRAAVEVFQPLEPGVLKLSQRLKTTFDPAGILGPGRMSTSF